MKICIDAGHNYSGADTGAQGNGLKEQNITFEIARKLKENLTAAGIEVIMTRNALTDNLGTSVASGISKRVEISNSNKCDYFVSIHCNAGGGTGTEVLVYRKGGIAAALAEVILAKVTTGLGLKSRGVKEQNVGVLRETVCPAVLVETAFIDTASDSALLANKQAEFGTAIAGGILGYLGISSPKEPTISEMKAFIVQKWGLSDPQLFFDLMDKHPYKDDLYGKIYKSYF